MGVMLKRLYVHNFKSFWESEFEFDKVNCLVAPNNAGKSNLMEALELLDSILKRDLSKAFTLKQNSENYRYKKDEIVFKAIFISTNTLLIDNNLMKYEIETNIDIRLNLNKLDFNIEVENNGKIKVVLVDDNDIKKDDFTLRKYNEEIAVEKYEEYLQELDKKSFTKLNNNNPLFNTLIGVKEINNKNFSKAIQNIFGTKDLISSFYFHPEVIKYMQRYETDFLLKDGTNLAYFLKSLDDETFEYISSSLIGEVELIESIELSTDTVPHILFNETVEGKVNKIIHQKVSDGTIHFLALMTVLYASKSDILLFEEPERHMHRKVLSYIIDTMRDSDKQIFFTTHSTEILQLLELNEIVFLYRDYNGDTQSKNANDIYNIKKIMRIYKNDLVEMLKTGILDDLNLEEDT